MKSINEKTGLTDQDIIDWIGQEVSEAEWCTDTTFDDYDPILEIETIDGDHFEIIVKPMESKHMRESNEDDLNFFKKMYGDNAWNALMKYCKELKKKPEDVVYGSDMAMNLFQGWAKRKLGVNIYDKFNKLDKQTDWVTLNDGIKGKTEYEFSPEFDPILQK